MREIILCKYGELALKGMNRRFFENMLIKELNNRLKPIGEFTVYTSQSTIYIEPETDDIDISEAFEEAKKVFGIVTLSRYAVVEKEIGAIKKTAVEYLSDTLRPGMSFKVEAKRSDKRFPLNSPQISAEVGGYLLEKLSGLKVDVHNPDITVRVEIRDNYAYITAGIEHGAGGMPIGSNGRGLLLLSGGIDSPVAGYMIAKRGVELEAVYYESFPYTSERAREKVLELAQLLCEYCVKIHVHVVSLTKLQETIVHSCNEEYFTLLLRRSMMRIAERIAKKYRCGALITGESLGQVASQTMEALGVTNSAVDMPVFRPCIGMDKEEIVTLSRNIGTFETSILPYEDCCTVFTPKHPKTRPELAKVQAEEAKYDYKALEDEAFETLNTYDIRK